MAKTPTQININLDEPSYRGEKRKRYEALVELRDQLIDDVTMLSGETLGVEHNAGEDMADIGSDNFQREIGLNVASEEGKKIYLRRLHPIEAIFGHFKYNLGYTRFLLRGLEKVKAEFSLMCLTYNLGKLIKHLLLLRFSLRHHFALPLLRFYSFIEGTKVRLASSNKYALNEFWLQPPYYYDHVSNANREL